jgi:putative DNA primase/helicase
MKVPVVEVDLDEVRAAKRAAQRDASGTATPPPGAIVITPGMLPALVDAAERALIEAREPMFQRDGRLVKIAAAAKRARLVDRDLEAPIIFNVESHHLVERLTAAACWVKFDSRRGEYREVDCPARVADTLLARRAFELPPLLGLIETPTLRADGSLLDAEGYDERTGLYLVARPAGWAGLPADLGRTAAAEAVELLSETFATFPFETPADESALIAGVLTGVLRPSLPAAPILAITAPAAGTGKTKLAEAIGLIATGHRPAGLAIGDDGAELEKRLGAVLLAGDPVVLIDNIERAVKSDLLCQMATQPAVQIRVLGVSARAILSTRSTLILTGNNLTIRGDLTRRTLRVRLDARVERPELRPFERDALDEVRAARAALVRAALTIPAAYLRAGAPRIDVPPFGSFDVWDRLVRRPLIWAGLPDPLIAARHLADEDPDREALREILATWVRVWGRGVAVTATEIVDKASGTHADAAALRDALALAIRDLNVRAVGYWLRANRDRPSGDLRLVRLRARRHGTGAPWAVLALSDRLPDEWDDGTMGTI